jgi:hypothetical protein
MLTKFELIILQIELEKPQEIQNRKFLMEIKYIYKSNSFQKSFS